MFTIYGLKNCDSCKKALAFIGSDAKLIDVRSFPLSDELLKVFILTFGKEIVNTRSKTWRLLGSREKNLSPLQLLKLHPTIMKRPIIECSKTFERTIGWNEIIMETYSI